MSGQIFISYRRDDSAPWARLVYTSLFQHFPQNKIFMDVDNLDPGIDFVEAIEESVGSCDVLIAVIGGRWLISSDEEGRRRLDNPEDFVHIEIATALKRGIRVIPVLVEGVSMPRPGDLPDDLKSLVRRNALEVSHNRFGADSERLTGAVERALETARAEQQRKREEEHGLDAEQRERDEKERVEAERRQREEKNRLEAERREREEKERLETERRERSPVLESKLEVGTRPELPTLAEKNSRVEPGQSKPLHQFQLQPGRIIILLIPLFFLSALALGILSNVRTPEGRSPPVIESLIIVAGIVAGVCYFAIFVCSTGWFVAMLSGWRRIYKAYPVRKGPLGKRFRMHGSVGVVHYNFLVAYVDAEGLRLSVPLVPFGFAHPPIFIPWTAIHRVESRRLLWLKYIQFDVGSPKIATVRLPQRILTVSPLFDRFRTPE